MVQFTRFPHNCRLSEALRLAWLYAEGQHGLCSKQRTEFLTCGHQDREILAEASSTRIFDYGDGNRASHGRIDGLLHLDPSLIHLYDLLRILAFILVPLSWKTEPWPFQSDVLGRSTASSLSIPHRNILGPQSTDSFVDPVARAHGKDQNNLVGSGCSRASHFDGVELPANIARVDVGQRHIEGGPAPATFLVEGTMASPFARTSASCTASPFKYAERSPFHSQQFAHCISSRNVPDGAMSASCACVNMRAARIGPTMCELDGPIPTLKRSKKLIAMVLDGKRISLFSRLRTRCNLAQTLLFEKIRIT